MLKTVLLWCARAFLMGGGLLTFFVWAPWLGCRPLADLANERIPVDRIPPDAGCYTVEQGKIVFASHGTVADDPYKFIATTAVLVLIYGLFLWSFRWDHPQQHVGLRDLFRAVKARQRPLALMMAIVFLMIVALSHFISR